MDKLEEYKSEVYGGSLEKANTLLAEIVEPFANPNFFKGFQRAVKSNDLYGAGGLVRDMLAGVVDEIKLRQHQEMIQMGRLKDAALILGEALGGNIDHIHPEIKIKEQNDDIIIEGNVNININITINEDDHHHYA